MSMKMRGKKTPEGITLKPEGDLVVKTAGQAHRLFRIGSKGAASVTVDLSGVEAMDACGLQLMVHLAKYFSKHNISFRMNRPTPRVSDVISEAGLGEVLTIHEKTGEAA